MAEARATQPGAGGCTAALAQLPALVAVVDRAIAHFMATSPRLACRHVVRERAPALICAGHPVVLQCNTCMVSHARHHDPVGFELRCDVCERVDEKIAGAVVPVVAVQVDVRDTKSYRRTLNRDQVLVAGIGVCRGCLAEIGVAA